MTNTLKENIIQEIKEEQIELIEDINAQLEDLNETIVDFNLNTPIEELTEFLKNIKNIKIDLMQI